MLRCVAIYMKLLWYRENCEAVSHILSFKVLQHEIDGSVMRCATGIVVIWFCMRAFGDQVVANEEAQPTPAQVRQ